MKGFNRDEQLLMLRCCPGTREGLIWELEAMRRQLQPSERWLGQLADRVIPRAIPHNSRHTACWQKPRHTALKNLQIRQDSLRFSPCLTGFLAAQSAHRNCAVMPKLTRLADSDFDPLALWAEIPLWEEEGNGI